MKPIPHRSPGPVGCIVPIVLVALASLAGWWMISGLEYLVQAL